MSELMDLVRDAENQLGLGSASPLPPWKLRMVEVGKLRNAMRTHPDITITDLRLALSWCRRRREPITTIADLFGKVEEAKQHAVVAERTSDLTLAHRDAVTWELDTDDDHSDAWLRLLVRSVGPARADALAEWRAAGRGPRDE